MGLPSWWPARIDQLWGLGQGRGSRLQSRAEGSHTTRILLDILSALGAADGGAAQVSIESHKETS